MARKFFGRAVFESHGEFYAGAIDEAMVNDADNALREVIVLLLELLLIQFEHLCHGRSSLHTNSAVDRFQRASIDIRAMHTVVVRGQDSRRCVDQSCVLFAEELGYTIFIVLQVMLREERN